MISKNRWQKFTIETIDHHFTALKRDLFEFWYHQINLSRKATRLFYWNLISKTRELYFTSIKNYIIYYDLNIFNSFFSIIVNSLINWIAQLNIKRVKTNIIKNYFIEIRSVYINMNFENFSIFQNFQLQKIIIDNWWLRGEIDIKK